MSNSVEVIFEANNQTDKAFDKMLKDVNRTADNIEKSTGKSTRAFNQMYGSINMVSSSLKLLSGAVSLAAISRLTKSILESGMAWDRLENAMLSVTGTTSATATELAFVTEEAKRLGLDLQTAGTGFTQLAAAAKGTKVTGKQVREIFTAVGEASVVLGLSAADSAGAIRAISQVMSKGTVQAEELRGQLGERIPGAFQIASRAMGKTTAELNKMLEQGKLLSDDFLPKFALQLRKELGATVPEATKKLQAELNRLKTSWFELQVEMSDGSAMETATQWVEGLTDAIDKLTDGIDALSDKKSTFQQTISWLNTGSMQILDFIQQGLGGGNRGEYTPEELKSMNLDGSYKQGSKISINGVDAFRDRTNMRELELALQQNTYRAVGSDSSKSDWTKKELEAYAKLGKDITDSWEQTFRDREEVQSRSLDVQIQLEEEAAKLSRIPWEATKDFWWMQADEKFEVLSRSTEALIALDETWKTSLMDNLDDLVDYYDETLGDRMAGTVFDAFSSMEDALIDFVMTGKASFSDMVDSILADITRLVIQQNITGPLASVLNTGLSGIFGSTVASANGNIFSNGRVVPFANGTIVTKPTYFPMAGGDTGLMGEAGEEAIMPLTRIGGKLGVLAQGGRGTQPIAIHQELHFNGDGRNAEEARQIHDSAVRSAVQAVLNDSRSRGPIARSLGR